MDFRDVPVVDGHCHPLLPDPSGVGPEAFPALFSEARPGTMAAHIPHTGYFQRALTDLARRLGCPATVEAVLAARREAGVAWERRALAESRVAALLVDTGYPPGAMPLHEMRGRLGAPLHEVVRIETCAEALLARRLPWASFVEAFREALHAAARTAVGLKSIIAYRSGLAVTAPSPEAAARGHAAELARVEAGRPPRLTDKALLDALLQVALDVAGETGRPLQLHTGFGDPDIDLLQSNPLLLRPILEDPRRAGVRIVLLHLAYPYVREAAFMAAVWPQVHVDLSLALPVLGPGAVPALVEALSLAPASKLLYGSDVGGLPELFALAADWGRAALGEALGWLVERGGLDPGEARRVGRRLLHDNAVALYALPGA